MTCECRPDCWCALPSLECSGISIGSGLEAHDPAQRRWLADRAAGVGADRPGRQPGGDRRGAASTRPGTRSRSHGLCQLGCRVGGGLAEWDANGDEEGGRAAAISPVWEIRSHGGWWRTLAVRPGSARTHCVGGHGHSRRKAGTTSASAETTARRRGAGVSRALAETPARRPLSEPFVTRSHWPAS